MTNLLEQLPDGGYPAEYLVSRIHGRRSLMVRDWGTLIEDPQSIERISRGRFSFRTLIRSPRTLWSDLMEEYRWAYGEMNGTLREIFAPFFFYVELHTLFTCIRLLRKNNPESIARALEHSLLSNRIKQICRNGSEGQSVLRQLADLPFPVSSVFKGLGALYEKEGLRSVEKAITNTYLTYAAKNSEHPLVRTFFRSLIDARNSITLYKALRHASAERPLFTEGGGIPLSRLKSAYESKDVGTLYDLIHTFTATPMERRDRVSLERELYAGITRKLLRSRNTGDAIGNILHYLWQRSLEVTNLSVIFHAGDKDNEDLAREIVP